MIFILKFEFIKNKKKIEDYKILHQILFKRFFLAIFLVFLKRTFFLVDCVINVYNLFYGHLCSMSYVNFFIIELINLS